jgi:hypothetical protein
MKVTAWDYAQSGLLKTKKLAESRGVTVQTELVDLNEAVWEPGCGMKLFVFLDISQKKYVKKAVKPGGYFLTEVFSIYQLPYKSGGPKDINLLYSPEEFIETFKDWRIAHFFMGEAIRHEGDLHTGLAHVIQFVGQKLECT